MSSISFIIPAKNEERYIGKTIEAILAQPAERVREIIVADNNSEDRTAEIAARYPKVAVVNAAVSGTNAARQAGLEKASGDIVAFIDSDNHVTPGWSERVVVLLQKPGVVGVSGPYDYTDQGFISRFFSLYGFIVLAYPMYLFFHYVIGIGSVVLGGNMAAKREALLHVGGLDTAFTFFGDDVNTGKRLRKAGYVVFAPGLRVGSSSRRFRKRGFVATIFKYFINFVWVMVFNRPFTK